jgi:microcystin degradation protein MlrC
VRIGVLGFAHESNTFVSVPTTLQRFSERGIYRGKGIIDRWKGSHHELGGFIAGSEANGFVAVPLMYSSVTPGGPLTDTAYETILGEMIGLLEKDIELDGLLLALHGAMVAESYSDADGEIVSRTREVFGDKPIVMTLDCHANVSSKMVDNVTATILYRTNPHVDQRDSHSPGPDTPRAGLGDAAHGDQHLKATYGPAARQRPDPRRRASDAETWGPIG